MADHNAARVEQAPEPEDLAQGSSWGEPAPIEPAPPQPAGERDSLRRALRDLEAAEARVQRNAERVYDETRSKLVLDLLPILDNLDRAIQAAEASSPRSVVDGMRMVSIQLEGVLVRYGVERLDTEGKRFDPLYHEAITALPVTDRRYNGMVIEQIQPGFRFNGKLLRAAKVVVGRFVG